jgi:peroxiredoxin
MKKFLFTCFLGGLCLFGSEIPVLSQVVDSPSGRGSVDAFPFQSGQEGSIPPAPLENQPKQSSTLLFYTQLMQRSTDSKLRITFLPDPLDAYSQAPDLREFKDSFQTGTLYDGAYGTVWSRISIPANRPGYLTLYLDESPVLENFLSLPADSVHLVLDRRTGQKIFTGPDYALYELQDRLQILLQQSLKKQGISIHYREGEEVFTNPAMKEAFSKNQQEFGPRQYLTKIDIPEMLHQLAIEVEEDSFQRDLQHLILFYRNKLPDSLLSFLQAQTMAEYWLTVAGKLQTLARYATESLTEKGLIEEFILQMDLGKSLPVEFGPDLPFAEKVTELHFNLAKLESNLRSERLENYLSEMPARLAKDLILAKTIVQQIKLGKGSFEQLKNLQGEITHKEISQKLDGFINAVQTGQSVGNFTFLDDQGQEVDLEQFRGKVLFINTYFTGCSASASYYSRFLSKLEPDLLSKDEFVLISISADRSEEIWKKGLNSGKYNSDSWVRLYAGEQGYSHPFFRKYLISAAPRPFLIDMEGNLIATLDLYQSPERLRELIKNHSPIKP